LSRVEVEAAALDGVEAATGKQRHTMAAHLRACSQAVHDVLGLAVAGDEEDGQEAAGVLAAHLAVKGRGLAGWRLKGCAGRVRSGGK